MDPVTVLGAVAATSQLVTQTSNLSSLAADTYHSFRNAPRDLDQLRKKVELLKSKVLQIEKFGDGLHGTDMEALFPQDHRFWYSNALAESVKSLNKLRSLRDSSRSGTARGKLAWAALDKRKADRIMVDLAETGEALDQALQIFSVRLGTLNHTSLGAFKVGQDAIHANGVQLQSSIHELQRVQTLTLSKMEEGNRSYTDLLRTEQAERAEDRKAIQAMREEMLVANERHDATVTTFILVSINAGIQTEHPFNTRKQRYNESPYLKRSRIKSHQHKVEPDRRTPDSAAGICLVQHAMAWRKPFNKSHQAVRRPHIRGYLEVGPRSGQEVDKLWRGIYTRHHRKRWYQVSQLALEAAPSTLDPESQEKQDRLAACEAILTYLLREGCDPNVQRKTLFDSRSLIAASLSLGGTKIPELLFNFGADPEWTPAFKYLSVASEDIMRTQLKLFHSWDILQWSTPEDCLERQNILVAYCKIGDVDLIIPQLEDGSLDINNTGLFSPTPLQLALEHGNLELAAVLLEYGADLELYPCRITDVEEDDSGSPEDSPLAYVLRRSKELHNAHFLLSYDADPGSTWDELFGCAFTNECVEAGEFSWDTLVGVATHMLLHNASCHFSISERKPSSDFSTLPGLYRVRRMAVVHTNTQLNVPAQQHVTWTDQGVISLDTLDKDGELYREHVVKKRRDKGLKQTRTTGFGAERRASFEDRDSSSGSDSEYDREIRHEDLERLKAARKPAWQRKDDATMHNPQAQQDRAHCDKTGFRDVVSTRKGRRQLSKFPLAVAYHTAVRLAGYRADIDDDGDIWWSDDDGDRYFDAHDNVVDGEEACAMCLRPGDWGLEGMQRRKAAGLAAVRKYRERNKGWGS
ncbi:hypothetical protein S40293_10440 [Stachybotrys chartarum IBT 40293]|nr:hypothetical protein S40293_10440 [Stachybotrys chartarum IBT 40293]